jgi:hypothetical protein
MTPGSPCETLAEEERLAWWAVEEYEVVMAEERLREDKELRENLRCIIFYSLYIYIYIYIYIYTTQGRGDLSDFYHTGRILILQQLERKLWKIADAFFRIS